MSTTRTIYLLRHGETEWNRDGNRYAGRTDLPLSEHGRTQAEAAAKSLAGVPFTHAFCSTLRRSRETAEIVADPHRLIVVADPLLVEIDYAGWEGKTRAEIVRDDPAGWNAWETDPEAARAGGTGETGREVANRMSAFIAKLDAAGPILIVGHNTLNRFFIASSLGMPLRNYRSITQDNVGVNLLDIAGPVLLWRRINHSVTAAHP